jgi:hypothetical protein
LFKIYKMKKLFILIAIFFVIFLTLNIKKILQPKNIVIVPTTTTKEKNLKDLDWGIDVNAPFQSRDSHGTVVFNNAIWVMGGLDGNPVTQGTMVQYWKAPHFADVWKSKNGHDWELVTDKAPWGKRRSLPLVVFKDKIWLIGGYEQGVGTKGDIWSTNNGKDWKLVTEGASFGAREGHTVTVFQDKLWLIGGVNFDKRETYNDVWYSEDGLIWKPATTNAPFSVRYDHDVSVFKDKMWLTGGLDFGDNISHDIWTSTDGFNWNLVTDHPGFNERHGHISNVFKDHLIIVSGWSDVEKTNDMWFSKDGLSWERNVINNNFTGREDHGVIIFNDKIWIIGGMDQNYKWDNHIWYTN